MTTYWLAILAAGEQSFEEFMWRQTGLLDGRPIRRDYDFTDLERDLRDAEADLQEAEARDLAAWATAQDAAHERAVEYHAQRSALDAAYRKRLEAMISRVKAWTPPKPGAIPDGHDGLRHIALDRLREELALVSRPYSPPVKMPVEDYRALMIKCARERVARCAEHLRNARDEQTKHNAWVDALEASIPLPTPSPRSPKEE